MIILGIDPGSRFTGWGVVSYQANQMTCISAGRIVLKEDSFSQRMSILYDSISEVITEYQPDCIAIEDVFVSKNARSALKLGHARGVLMLAVSKYGQTPVEISARKVKQAITGSGAADKAKVAMMLKHLLSLKDSLSADASDALGIAIACGHMVYKSQRLGDMR